MPGTKRISPQRLLKPLKRVGLLIVTILTLGLPGPAGADCWGRRYTDDSADGLGLVGSQVRPTAGCDWLVGGVRDELLPGGEFDSDTWVMRLDDEGIVLWSLVLGGDGEEGSAGIAETPEGGVLVATNSESFVAPFLSPKPWFVKLDSAGVVEWQRSYEAGTLTRVGITLTSGDTVHLGRLYGDLWILRLDPDGVEVWQRRIRSLHSVGAVSLERTSDGGFVIAGEIIFDGASQSDHWVIKLDAAGEIEWQKAYGDSQRNRQSRVAQLAGGGYLLAGEIRPETDARELVFLGLDPSGEIIWQSRYLEPAGLYWNVHGVLGVSDGDAVAKITVTSRSVSTDGRTDLLKFDPVGRLVWVREYNGGDEADVFGLVEPLSDGGFATAGIAMSFDGPDDRTPEAWLVRLDQNGLVGGETCGFIRTLTPPQEMALNYTAVDTDAVVEETAVGWFGTAGEIADLPVTMTEQCSVPACIATRCGIATASPQEICEGEEVTLRLSGACGEGAVTVGWDLDGDTVADEQGFEVAATLPTGSHEVTATATDACPDPGPGSCEATAEVTVLPADPPGEISGSTEPRLRVVRRGEALRVEAAPETTAYNVYADRIGSWYAPTAATGSACGLAGTDVGGGIEEIDYLAPSGSWIVVTASTPCAEGPAGPDSEGTERTASGSSTWDRCGPTR